jgi:hypothetical protein
MLLIDVLYFQRQMHIYSAQNTQHGYVLSN